MTVEEAEHQIATRLFQNNAKVHFNQFSEGQGRFGRRLIYGGHVISLARALSFNGLANAFHIAAINGGRHVAPLFAGDTVFAWSEILDRAPLPGRDDVGALRLRMVATKNRPCADFPLRDGEGYDPAVILDLDYLGPRAALKGVSCACPATPFCCSSICSRRSAIPVSGRATMRARRRSSRPCSPPGAPRLCRSSISAMIRRSAASPYRPDAPGHAFLPQARPREGETIIGKSANSAFVATDLEAALDRLGATTLVVCGVLTNNSLEATVRHGGNLGYRIFVVADACWAVDKRDLSGRLWPAADVHALSLANMQGEYAEIVSGAMALQAAAMANMRRRRQR